MKIEKNSYVSFHFKITDEENEVLEETTDEPDFYIHGQGEALEAVEKELEGKEKGYKTTISLKPEDAFGDYEESLVTVVKKSDFDHTDDLEIGMEFLSDDSEDEDMSSAINWRIIDIEGDEVTLDANHPYAGINLTFNIEVVDVRPATEEELKEKSCCGGGCGDDDCGCSNGTGCNCND